MLKLSLSQSPRLPINRSKTTNTSIHPRGMSLLTIHHFALLITTFSPNDPAGFQVTFWLACPVRMAGKVLWETIEKALLNSRWTTHISPLVLSASACSKKVVRYFKHHYFYIKPCWLIPVTCLPSLSLATTCSISCSIIFSMPSGEAGQSVSLDAPFCPSLKGEGAFPFSHFQDSPPVTMIFQIIDSGFTVTLAISLSILGWTHLIPWTWVCPEV